MSARKRFGLGCCVVMIAVAPVAPARAGAFSWAKVEEELLHWYKANSTTSPASTPATYYPFAWVSPYHHGSSSNASTHPARHPSASTHASAYTPSYSYTPAASPASSYVPAYTPAVASPAPATAPAPVTYFGGFAISSATSSAVTPVSVSSVPVSAPLTVAPPLSAVSSVSVSAPATSATPSASTPDAFLNFTGGPFLEASALTTGGASAWYNSASVRQVYGGNTPTAQQQSDFTNTVLQDVQKTFQLAGLSPKLTLDPNAHASHTLSVVSGASYGPNPGAIGITDVGANGFGFIDKLSYASTPDELAMAVAHNVSHELMHAFGVAVHHDQTGNFIDAGTASWPLLTDPNATFSQAAADDIKSQFQSGAASASTGLGAEDFDFARPVPEPATIAAWSLGLAAALLARRRSRIVASPG